MVPGPGMGRDYFLYYISSLCRDITVDSEGATAPRAATDSSDQWVWCLMHMRSMLHVISVTCLV